MTNRKRILVIVFGLLVSICDEHSALGAVTEAWVQRYSNSVSNSMDEALLVAIDPSGDVIIAGYSEDGTSGPYPWGMQVVGDMIIIKYSGTEGSVLWQKRVRKPTYTIAVSGLATDSGGNVVVVGSSLYNELATYTAKYAAADGAVLWENIIPRDSWPSVAVDANDDVIVADRNITKYDGENGESLWATEQIAYRWVAVAVDASRNVIVTGPSAVTGADFLTAKYAATDGTLLWQRSYNGPKNGYDSPTAIAVDGGGNVVVTGNSSGSLGHSADYYTAKYASTNGALLWEQIYDGPPGMQDWPVALAVDGAGNVIVTGESFGSEGLKDYYTAKYAATNGALMWDKREHHPGTPKAVVVDANGDAIVTGTSQDGETTFPNYYFPDYYIAKYAAANGSLVWEKFGTEGVPADMAKGDDSIVIVGASKINWAWAYYDAYTAKYSIVDGTLLWDQRYNRLANNLDAARATVIDRDGNVIVTGESFGSEGNGDYYTAKYAGRTGALLWEKRYNGPGKGTDRAQAVAIDQSGNVVVTGYSWNGTNWDWYTAKYASADGNVVWEKRYDGPGNGDDTAYAVALDGSGNVVVTGDSSGTVGGGDFYTVKYATADGSVLWERRYNGPASDYDSSRDVAIDRDGNAIVTGYTTVGGYHDYYTAKYAAADGALLWERRSGSALYDQAFAVAIDSRGNAVVTGDSNDDYYTVKYAAADGSVLWDKRYDGPGHGWDCAQDVAIDGNDNAIVTGYSRSATTNRSDYYTAKYAATDGRLLWEKRYDGPGSGSDSATAVAVDIAGNVLVTGTSSGDYYTAKYAAMTGALLWERRYNGPADQEDVGTTLAVGVDGLVVVTGTADHYRASDIVERSDYVTIAYLDNSPSVSIQRVPTGLGIRFNGSPGRNYEVQRASALSGPWSTIATIAAPSEGMIEYIDVNQPIGSAFYRARVE